MKSNQAHPEIIAAAMKRAMIAAIAEVYAGSSGIRVTSLTVKQDFLSPDGMSLKVSVDLQISKLAEEGTPPTESKKSP